MLILVNSTSFLLCGFAARHTGLSDDNSEREPPDSIPNSEVKPLSADGSVGSPHVRVGHRQALYDKRLNALHWGVFFAHKYVENISILKEKE